MDQTLTCGARFRELKSSLIALSTLVLLGSLDARANPPPHKCAGPLVGSWKLQSFVREDAQTGQKTEPYGAHPGGYIHYASDCRMYVMVVKENRKAPIGEVPTDAERIELFGGLIAYAGTYTVDGDKVSHHIDTSWNQAWTGTTQVRQFKTDGTSLSLKGTTVNALTGTTGREGSFVVTWTKVE